MCWGKKVRRNGEGHPEDQIGVQQRGQLRRDLRTPWTSAGAARCMSKMWVTRGETTVVTVAVDGVGRVQGQVKSCPRCYMDATLPGEGEREGGKGRRFGQSFWSRIRRLNMRASYFYHLHVLSEVNHERDGHVDPMCP